MNPIDRLFDNLKGMIRDGMADGQTTLDKLVSNIYLEIGDYHSEPDVYGLSMNDDIEDGKICWTPEFEEPEESFLVGHEEYELCIKCQNSKLMGTECHVCRCNSWTEKDELEVAAASPWEHH